MSCQKMDSKKLADLLLDPQSDDVETRRHVEECAGCARDLAELRSTLGLLDTWAAPEVNPFFDSRLMARLREEQQASPAGFLERWKARLLYGSSVRMQPVLAGALAVAILAGGGTYADLSWQMARRTQESATLRDLQSLDGNDQVFQQLDSVDQSDVQQNQESASPAND